MLPIQFKRSPYLWLFSAVLVAVTGVLIWHHDVKFTEGAAFITGALAMPGLFGKKKDKDDTSDDDDSDSDKKDPPAAGGATPLVVGAMLAVLVCSCTPAARLALIETIAEKGQCAIANMNLPEAQIIAKCALTPEDVPHIIKMVGVAREQNAQRAVEAAAIQKDADDRRDLAGCGGYRDGGARP